MDSFTKPIHLLKLIKKVLDVDRITTISKSLLSKVAETINKLPKIFYKNGQKLIDYCKVLVKSAERTREIFETKRNYIVKMTNKLEDSNTAPKTY